MANNLIQVKRTSVSGRAANTTTLSNPGELALNMADGILYSGNGTAVFEIGANTTNSRVTGNLTIKGIIANGSLGTSGYVLKSNGSAAYWDSDGADVGAANQILYRNSSNVLTSSSGLVYDGVSIKVNGNLESLYNNGSEGGEIFLNKPASGTTLAGTGVTLDIFENKLRIFENGGTNRGAYIDITAASAGVGSNLLSGGGGGGSVNVSAQYAWTNTHSFSANVAFTGNNITVVSNTGSVMFAGAGDTNWRIGRSTGAFTKRFYTNNSLDFIAANSNLEGIAFGYTGSEVYLETGYNGTYTKNPVYIGTVNSTSNGIVVGTTSINIGNSSVNSTINSTSFSGTSNNSTNLNGKAESALNVNSALTANNSSNLGGTAAANFVQNTDSRTLSGNLIFSGANVTFSGNMRVSGGLFANGSRGTAGQILASNGTSIYWTTDQTSGNVSANAITTNSLAANYMTISTGTLSVGNSTVNTDIGNNYVSVGNSSGYVNVYSSYIYIGNSSANATVNSTIYTGTANNASYLGGTIAAAYVQNTDSRTLSGNLIFSGANVVYNTGLKVATINATSNGVAINATSFVVGNSTVNSTINSTAFTGTSLTANNASFLGGTAAANFVQNTDSRTLSGNLNFTGGNTFFSNTVTFRGITGGTNGSAVAGFNKTLIIGGAYNQTYNTGNSVLLHILDYSNDVGDNVYPLYIEDEQNFPDFYLWAGNSDNTATKRAYFGGNVGINTTTPAQKLDVNGSIITSTSLIVGNSSVNVTINSTSFTGTSLSSNNASFLGGTAAASFVQNTDSRTLSGNLVLSGANNTVSGNLTIASTGELIITNGAGIYANGGLGTSGQVLTTNGSSVYWAAATSSFTNGTSISVNNFTLTGGFTANGSLGTLGQVLTSNASSAYWSNSVNIAVYYANDSLAFTGTGVIGTVAGSNTQVQFNNSGVQAGDAGLTYNTTTDSLTVANNINVASINGNNVLTIMESLRANRNLTGGGTITVDASGYVLWSARFIVIANGRGTHFSTAGYFDINNVTSGTVTGLGGAANKTATAAGIPLLDWEALYYILPIGSTNASLAANFRVVNYTADVEVPSNWVLICVKNGDEGKFYFNNGVTLKAGQSYVSPSDTSTTVGSNTYTIGTGTYFVANGNVGIANTTPAHKLSVEGTIRSSSTISDAAGNLRDVPVVTKAAVYELAAGDGGEGIVTTANVNVNGAVLTTGFVATIFNNSAASITITSGAGVTMYLGGTATTGNRTVAQRGLATVYMVASNTFVISGAGVT